MTFLTFPTLLLSSNDLEVARIKCTLLLRRSTRATLLGNLAPTTTAASLVLGWASSARRIDNTFISKLTTA
jgi:hypothetical protein